MASTEQGIGGEPSSDRSPVLFSLSKRGFRNIPFGSLGRDAKCFKLLGSQFEYRGNTRTLDVVHGNQIRCWKNGTVREVRCGIAGNKRPTLLSVFAARHSVKLKFRLAPIQFGEKHRDFVH
ncbi:hypothetical protein IVA86_32535 [Bradyrhizobium sp. 146]|uniref:hypothetical protein n=1 Tax=Bradyrhizobium sp. 146 TaxID=2782622 RepID=UPI001FF9FF83|nr:hypothetical protein [Bradyrhizobium sp. 146]MCK1706006.1 hypothetical protein [Bradyrhizobium sp. 146]